jgi:trehalose-phosphatase
MSGRTGGPDDRADDRADGLLPARLVEALRVLAARPDVLLALDFDGCLAPIVPDPDDARPLPEAREALHRLVQAPGTTVALVSGRSLDALRRLAAPPPRALLVGSHGAEYAGATASDDADGDGPDGPARHLLRRVIDAVARIVEEHPGTTMETKPTAAVLHTRRADRPEAEAATAAALAGPATWGGVHAMRGKEVVELSVTDVTKGTALRRLRAVAGLVAGGGGVLYAGDDVTDERAFAVLDDDAGDITVKVGNGDTAARHRVADPQAVAVLLQELAALRDG